jgi:AcrR family transcriptional regulator
VPKVVDHQERRAQIADAVWTLVMRDGVEAASIRRVAAEAGCSAGSLRHYFTTHGELLEFAMRLAIDRVRDRLESLPGDLPPLEQAERALLELLPLDCERRAEMQVWLAFSMRAATDPALRPLREESDEALGAFCAGLVERLNDGEPDELRAQQLHAFVDGLALHAVLAPETASPARIRELLADYLRGIPMGRQLPAQPAAR